METEEKERDCDFHSLSGLPQLELQFVWFSTQIKWWKEYTGFHLWHTTEHLSQLFEEIYSELLDDLDALITSAWITSCNTNIFCLSSNPSQSSMEGFFVRFFFFQAFYGFYEDKYKMLRKLEFNPMWTPLASSDFYRTSQELNFISLLNHTATRNSKNNMHWTCALISKLWIISTPCVSLLQCDSQGRAAMCRPAADHIKHGWLAVRLTDGRRGTPSQASFDVRDAQHVIHTTAFFPHSELS